ncbi:hypothetical protein ACFV9C_32270 [Kribbella sp. NPDC059898]|uniref:hypothetical protein n=1 Tax=Kribbella sp. NPDC059898 TaxID=3346995 RepID=UPI00364A62EB
MSKYLLNKFLYTVDRDHDHVALFELGAHPFLTLTLFIAMFERDHGPLEYQKAYGHALQHHSLPYPDIAT